MEKEHEAQRVGNKKEARQKANQTAPLGPFRGSAYPRRRSVFESYEALAWQEAQCIAKQEADLHNAKDEAGRKVIQEAAAAHCEHLWKMACLTVRMGEAMARRVEECKRVEKEDADRMQIEKAERIAVKEAKRIAQAEAKAKAERMAKADRMAKAKA